MNVPKGLRGYHGPVAEEDRPRPTHVYCDELGPQVPLMSCSPTQWIAKHGLILRCMAGSVMYGLSTGGGDEDQLGICVEPPELVIGHGRFEQYQFRTQPEGVCSGPGDLDLVVYGLRKYVELATKGNPTILTLLFVHPDHILYQTELGEELIAKRDLFLSRQVADPFAGYLESQRRGLLGLRSGGTRNQGRKDLREKFTFDAKFAAHMVRLGFQGVELLKTGHITLPMPEPERSYLMDLRTGVFLEGKDPTSPEGKALGAAKKAETIELAERLKTEINELANTTSPLPEKPDMEAIDAWVVAAHRRYWKW